MRKILLLIALIALSVFVAGCTDGEVTTSNDRTFVGGTDGVVISFEPSAPPTEVIKGEGFNVVVVLTNEGEHTILATTYELALKGFSPVDFDTSSTELTVTGEDLLSADINPDTGETIEPYDVYITIPEDELNYVGGVSGNMEYPLTVEMCYPYRTEAYGNLCVKEELQDSTDTDVCTITGAKDLTSSGAPVQIRNLEEYSGGSDKIRFNFEIFDANAGARISSIEGFCEDTYSNENYVTVTVDTGFDGELSCNGLDSDGTGVSGEIKLNGGLRKITCSQTISNSEKGDYIKTISISADYNVQQSINTKILIKNLD